MADLIDQVLNDPEKLKTCSSEIFVETDKDKSGFVDISELGQQMDQLADMFGIPHPTADQVKSVLASFDLNHDSKLSPVEFQDFARATLVEMSNKLKGL